MTIKASTGLRTGVLVTGSMRSLLNGGTIRLFSGAAPADADAAETGTLLCVISLNSSGTGLTFEATAPGGVLTKTASEVWSGVNSVSGTATHYRHVGSADTHALSTTEPRLQGTVGAIGADMNLSSTTLTSGATQTIDYCVVTLPTP